MKLYIKSCAAYLLFVVSAGCNILAMDECKESSSVIDAEKEFEAGVLYPHKKLDPVLYELLDPLPKELIAIILDYYNYEPCCTRTVQANKAAGAVRFLCFLDQGVIVVGFDNGIETIDSKSGESLHFAAIPHIKDVLKLSKNRFIVSDDQKIQLYEGPSCELKRTFSFSKDQIAAYDKNLRIARLKALQIAVSSIAQGKIKLIDLSPKEPRVIREFPILFCTGLAKVPGKKVLVVMDKEYKVRFLNYETGRAKPQVIRPARPCCPQDWRADDFHEDEVFDDNKGINYRSPQSLCRCETLKLDQGIEFNVDVYSYDYAASHYAPQLFPIDKNIIGIVDTDSTNQYVQFFNRKTGKKIAQYVCTNGIMCKLDDQQILLNNQRYLTLLNPQLGERKIAPNDEKIAAAVSLLSEKAGKFVTGSENGEIKWWR